MMKTLFNTRNLTLTGIILFSAISRLFPVIPNFQPVLAMSLFAGLFFENKKLAILVPLLSMFISDVALHFLSQSVFGFYSGFHATMPFVYGSLIAISLIGNIFSKNANFKSIIIGSLASSVLFFIVTNFGAWLLFNMYPHTMSGFVLCYEMALPFFRYTLLSTFVYSSILFYAFKLAESKIPVYAK